MQLSLDLFGASPLAQARALLLSRFRSEQSASRRDPISQLVKSILSSQTYDAVSAAAYERVRRHFGVWENLMNAEPGDVQALIADVTYAEVKAPCLITALKTIHAHAGRLTLDFLGDVPTEAALCWLERINGIGRKISAAVMNFSTLRGAALAIDTHVLRVSQRLGWVSPRAKTAEQAYAPMMALVPPDWTADTLYEMHWLMKRLGQSFCRFNQTECAQCPLVQMCRFAKSNKPERGHDALAVEAARMVDARRF